MTSSKLYPQQKSWSFQIQMFGLSTTIRVSSTLFASAKEAAPGK
jgi:hypothetical protein